MGVNKSVVRGLIGFGLCVALLGCDQSDSSTSSGGGSGSSGGGITSLFSSSKPDPAESFKTFAAKFHAAAQGKLTGPANAWTEEIYGKPGKRMLVVFDKYEIDVKKTDSLISPYTGIIAAKVQQADEEQKTLPITWRVPLVLTFAYQENKWVLKSALIEQYWPFSNNYDSEEFKNADIMQPQGYPPFKIIRDRLRAASQEAGGA